MNPRFLKIAVISFTALFCVTSYGQTWTRVGSATPFTDYPTGTSGTTTQYRVSIGAAAAAANSQLYVISQAASLVPIIINTQPSPTVDIARFQAGGSTKVVITSTGAVGIGTTTTGSCKLVVAGKIAAREVIVTQATTWPDFVFNKDYKLKPLEEVEKHFTEKKHLENIPTAAEVKANGVSVGEMQTKLLQKVEEMTLYLVALNKENKDLKKQVEEMRTIVGK